MIRCLHCGAETSNGLALCDLCRRLATDCLTYLQLYIRNLARWTPGRTGSRKVPGSRVLYDGTTRGTGTGDKISDALDEVNNDLVSWARALVDARPQLARLHARLVTARTEERVTEAEAAVWLCKGFDRYLTSISTIDWCGEFLRKIVEHEERLRTLTESYVPGWYAGGCRQVVGFDDEGAAVRCDSGTYVVPGLSWVTCRACGTTTYARDHLENIIDEASGWVGRPKALAEAVVALVDTEQSVTKVVQRIRWWAHKEWLTPIQHTKREHKFDPISETIVLVDEPVGYARYRFGDVLDQVLRDTRRQANVTKESQAS